MGVAYCEYTASSASLVVSGIIDIGRRHTLYGNLRKISDLLIVIYNISIKARLVKNGKFPAVFKNARHKGHMVGLILQLQAYCQQLHGPWIL